MLFWAVALSFAMVLPAFGAATDCQMAPPSTGMFDAFGSDASLEGFDPEGFMEEMNKFVAQMSPEEYAEFERARQEAEDELGSFITSEAERLGVTPEKYFEQEFSGLFENQNVMLAQSGSVPPGMEVSESNFGVAAPSGKRPAPGVSKKKEKKRVEKKSDKPDADQKERNTGKPAKGAKETSKKTAGSGNWLKKLYFFREGEKLLAEGSKLLEEVRKKRASFYREQLDEIDETLESFFKKVGVERGNAAGLSEYIETVVGYKISALSEMEKDLDSSTDESIDLILYQVEERVDGLKIELSSAKSEIEMIVDLDRTVNERISVMDDHIASAEEDFSKMEEDLKKIDETYSHQEASELYGQIEGSYDRIVAIDQYVKEVGAKNIEKMKDSILSSTQKINDRVTKMNDEATKLLEKLEKSAMKNSAASKARSKKISAHEQKVAQSKENAQKSANMVFGKIKSALQHRGKNDDLEG